MGNASTVLPFVAQGIGLAVFLPIIAVLTLSSGVTFEGIDIEAFVRALVDQVS